MLPYFPMIEAHANRYKGGKANAEFDDLFQEGSIAVADAIADGFTPSNVVVENAMKDWVRKCHRWARCEPLPDE